MVRQDDAFSLSIELWSTCAAHHLKHVLRAELDPFAELWAVDLGALEDDRVSR